MSKRRDDDSFSSSESDSDSYESDDCDTFFWGCTLTRQNPIFRWGERMDDSRCSAFFQEHRLTLRQAVLGAGAVEGERNVVAVDCENYDKEMVELPILSLTLNHQDMCGMNMNFEWPCVFRLGQGSGPVIITGEHHVTYLDDDDDDEDDDEDSESSTSSEHSLKSKKKDKKTATPVNSSRMSTSSMKDSSKSRAKKARRSESSEKPEKKKKPAKSGSSKGRPSKEAGAKHHARGTAEGKAKKKKKVTGGKKVTKKTKASQVKVKEEP